MMSTPAATPADQLLHAERARRPRWMRSAAPRWFRGQELDVLAQDERYGLYLETKAATGGSSWFAWAMLLVWTPKVIEHIVAGQHRALSIGGTATYVLVVLGALLLRRRGIVNAARRSVREAADWPLRRLATRDSGEPREAA